MANFEQSIKFDLFLSLLLFLFGFLEVIADFDFAGGLLVHVRLGLIHLVEVLSLEADLVVVFLRLGSFLVAATLRRI